MSTNNVDCVVTGWTCYWRESGEKCGYCTRNREIHGNSKPRPQDYYITHEEKVTEFYDYLIAEKTSKGVTRTLPKLTQEQAFGVIWFLQEITRCLPDTIEQCNHCKILFDSNCEGTNIDAEWEWTHDDEVLVMPEEYYGSYHDECVPYRKCVKKD